MKRFKMEGVVAILLAFVLVLSACGAQGGNSTASVSEEKSESVAESSEAPAESSEEVAESSQEAQESTSEEVTAKEPAGEARLGRGYSESGSEDGFIRAVVVAEGDKIVSAKIDEFCYMGEDAIGVPNFDAEDGFGKGAVEGKILGSKVVNNETYSANMAEKAGSTVSMVDNFKAIEEFVKGKTVAELEKVVAEAEPHKAIDAITGATLGSGANYLTAIINAAKEDALVDTLNADDLAGVELKAGQYAPHGNKSFADYVVAMEGEKVAGVSFDEFQYIKGSTGVPTADKKMAESFASAEVPLASKRVNAESYSAHMKEAAGSTVSLDENYKLISDFAVGKTLDEIAKSVENKDAAPSDIVSGATLADTVGYLTGVVEIGK